MTLEAIDLSPITLPIVLNKLAAAKFNYMKETSLMVFTVLQGLK